MLVTGSERMDIPHEPGEFMELKRLNAKKLSKAREAKTLESINMMQQAGSEFMAQARSAASETKEARAANADPLDDFDAWKLCEYGIKAWSYDAEVTVANIEELDETTLKWAARSILKASGIEADPLEMAKNGLEPFIVGSMA